MQPKKAHCFFEQSGTFKNQFIELGIPAEDYDIQNQFGETDHVIDLYSEIDKAVQQEPSIFDAITSDELIMAFFPCIRFEDQITLFFRGDAYQQRDMDMIEKLNTAIRLQNELTELYNHISNLVIVCLQRNIPLIIENPYSGQHYLKLRWPLKPSIVDMDRRDRGDQFKKPTQYWFVNCEPSNNLLFEPQFTWETYLKIDDVKNPTKRSMITKEYAGRFIREFIL